MKYDFLYDKLVGDSTKEIGAEQPEKSLMAVNQTEVAGVYKYAFNLSKMYYLSGDTTNIIDNEAECTDPIGSFTLADLTRSESTMFEQVQLLYKLEFQVAETDREAFIDMLNDYVKGQIGNVIKTDDKFYFVTFPDGGSVTSTEKYEEDGVDKFLCNIIFAIFETDQLTLWQDIKLENVLSSGNERIRFNSYTENRKSELSAQPKANTSDLTYRAKWADFVINLSLPELLNNNFCKSIKKYKNTGVSDILTIKMTNSQDETDTYIKKFKITSYNATGSSVGAKNCEIQLNTVGE